jgi:hypothetical protein
MALLLRLCQLLAAPNLQPQRLLYFLVDQLKLFLIGCVAFALKRSGPKWWPESLSVFHSTEK